MSKTKSKIAPPESLKSLGSDIIEYAFFNELYIMILTFRSP